MPTIADARRLLSQARERAGHPPHLNALDLRVNARLRSTWARAYPDQHVIELSARRLRECSQAELADTIAHEVAHLLSGERRVHGRAWRMWCLHLGGTGNVTG